MSKDKLEEAKGLVFDWGMDVETGKMIPPTAVHKFPDFVRERLNWLLREDANNELSYISYMGKLLMMLGFGKDEKELKDEWEFGTDADYLPFSHEYKEWLDDPTYGDLRQQAIAIALIYGFNDDESN